MYFFVAVAVLRKLRESCDRDSSLNSKFVPDMLHCRLFQRIRVALYSMFLMSTNSMKKNSSGVVSVAVGAF